MTFNNWKELSINGIKLKRLVRASDGLILFEQKSEPSFKGLCFTAEEDSSISFIKTGSPDALTLQTSYDGNTWSDYSTDDTITLTQGQKIYFRNKNTITQIGKSTSAYWKFGLTGKISASGNINSLLTPNFDGGNVTLGNYCFTYLFDGCTSLTKAPALPATTLASQCYYQMFRGCTALTQAPALPATALATACYFYMFNGCTSLAQAPALPATTLASQCYQNMFYGCTSLTKAPALPATTIASQCYYQMFRGCTALTQAPALPATTIANGCYSSMFYGCTSLAQAPALPATTLGQTCYQNMFRGCTALTQAPALPATVLKLSCYSNMFYGCTALTSVPKIAASTSYATGCMTSMFNGCGSLSYIEVDMTKWPATSQMTSWVTGVAKEGVFKCPQELPEEHATNRIPVGWTVVRK